MISLREAESLVAHMSNTKYWLPMPDPPTQTAKKIFAAIQEREDPLNLIEGKNAFGDIPAELRPYIKAVRIPSSIVWDTLFDPSYPNAFARFAYKPVMFNQTHDKLKTPQEHVQQQYHPSKVVHKRRRYAAEVEDRKFRHLTSELLPNRSLKRVRRLVNPNFPWLVGSPDGVYFKDGQPTALLEIKHTHRDPLNDSGGPMLRKFKGSWELIRWSKTWCQVQTMLAISELDACHLWSISSRNGTIHMVVERDEKGIDYILQHTKSVYFGRLIPLMEDVAYFNGV